MIYACTYVYTLQTPVPVQGKNMYIVLLFSTMFIVLILWEFGSRPKLGKTCSSSLN